MITIADLEFWPNDALFGGDIAKVPFDNGYRLAIITGGRLHIDAEHPYSFHVWDEYGHLVSESFGTPGLDLVLNEAEANAVLQKIEERPGAKGAE